jgi:hypothetical protein
MLVIAFVDWRSFKFYPLQAGIFMDVSGRNHDDLALFNQLKNYVATHNSQDGGKITVYEVFYKK